jgi:hypothetical protein
MANMSKVTKTTKKEEAIITIARAFENSLTLPLITFLSM